MDHQSMIDIIQAHKDGKEIQARKRFIPGSWLSFVDSKPRFDFSIFDYRVKPEPRQFWFDPNPSTIAYPISEFPTPPFKGAIKVREVLEW